MHRIYTHTYYTWVILARNTGCPAIERWYRMYPMKLNYEKFSSIPQNTQSYMTEIIIIATGNLRRF